MPQNFLFPVYSDIGCEMIFSNNAWITFAPVAGLDKPFSYVNTINAHTKLTEFKIKLGKTYRSSTGGPSRIFKVIGVNVDNDKLIISMENELFGRILNIKTVVNEIFTDESCDEYWNKLGDIFNKLVSMKKYKSYHTKALETYSIMSANPDYQQMTGIFDPIEKLRNTSTIKLMTWGGCHTTISAKMLSEVSPIFASNSKFTGNVTYSLDTRICNTYVLMWFTDYVHSKTIDLCKKSTFDCRHPEWIISALIDWMMLARELLMYHLLNKICKYLSFIIVKCNSVKILQNHYELFSDKKYINSRINIKSDIESIMFDVIETKHGNGTVAKLGVDGLVELYKDVITNKNFLSDVHKQVIYH
jgi:hypothetical protein